MDAEQLMIDRKVKKLPLVADDGALLGLITARDLLRQRRLAVRDARRAGPAPRRAPRSARPATISSAPPSSMHAGVDVIVIDIAHGHSSRHGERDGGVPQALRATSEMIAGNVAHGRRRAVSAGARRRRHQGRNRARRRLHDAHDDQLRRAADSGARRVPPRDRRRATSPIIADGGIRRHGGIAEALLFGGDCTMLGSAFAGTEEAPGEIVHKSVLLPESQKTVKVPFKVLRGMASLEAIRDRLDVEDADRGRARGARCRGHGDQRAGARLRADDRPRHDQAPVLVDQLRRRRQPRASCGPSSGRIRERYLIKQSASARRESYER